MFTGTTWPSFGNTVDSPHHYSNASLHLQSEKFPRRSGLGFALESTTTPSRNIKMFELNINVKILMYKTVIIYRFTVAYLTHLVEAGPRSIQPSDNVWVNAYCVKSGFSLSLPQCMRLLPVSPGNRPPVRPALDVITRLVVASGRYSAHLPFTAHTKLRRALL